MAINIPGLIAVILFYVVMLLIGLWASKRALQKKTESQSEDVMLAGRSLGFVIGSITLTGEAWNRYN